MGICHSSESAWEQESDESTVYVIGEEELDCDDGGGGGGADDGVAGGDGGGKGVVRRLASLYSRQGRKGPNQDSAILCQGYGAEDGVFCGVFDGHGKNGHIVSRMVRDYLPSLLLSNWNIVTADAGHHDGRDFLAMSPEWMKEWKEACTNGFKAMDGELLTKLDCSYSGTTAVTIIKQGKDVVIANLGDSRAVLAMFSSDGRLQAVQLTTDLTPSLPHICRPRTSLHSARILHSLLLISGRSSDVLLATDLINIYSHLRDVPATAATFTGISKKNIFSWNSMISAFVLHGSLPDALLCFLRLLAEIEIRPDSFTLPSPSNSCRN